MTTEEFKELIASGKIVFTSKGFVSNEGASASSLPKKEKPKKRPKKSKNDSIPFSPKTHFDILAQQVELCESLKGEYHIDIVPVPKPRMTQSDKWKKRPAVVRYYQFCDDLRHKTELMGLTTLPMQIRRICYIIPMPKSWSKRDRTAMNFQPHFPKPDIDNLRKALQDAICKEDSHIARVLREEKVWGEEGKIIIEI